jgi:4-amino-4-deoxy-L-arabinose transferase-like glycosyltransferase
MPGKINFTFWIFTISVLIGLIVPVLIQDGMFMDGVLYACVSNNLANGEGSFWFPVFSKLGIAGQENFHEHPPLVFGIQSLFFKVFGESMYVERFYSFLMACITAFLIHAVWKLLSGDNKDLQKISWLPVLLWISVPVCFWSFQNNIQENTMGVFALASVLFALKFYYEKKAISSLIISGVFIFLATFSKGLPGFFPLAIPFLYMIAERKISFGKMVVHTLILVVVTLGIYLLLMLDADAYESIRIYINERLLKRIDSVHTVSNRFHILEGLLAELAPILGVCLLFLFIKRKTIIQERSFFRSKSFLFLLIGLSATLPLMLTLVQKRFYFAHAIPFFAVSLAFLVAPHVITLLKRINPSGTGFRLFQGLTFVSLIAVISVSFMMKGKTSRNHDLLHDVYIIGNTVERGSVINIEPSLWNSFDLQCYLVRYFHISVDPTNEKHNYYLTKKNSHPGESHKQKLELGLVEYELYEE